MPGQHAPIQRRGVAREAARGLLAAGVGSRGNGDSTVKMQVG